jgi:hypothetical protein
MANRFWVGGTGTWDSTNTANWSTTSGGAGGASVPTSADFVTFNASSGGGAITLAFDAPCQGIDFRDYTGVFDFSTYVITASGNGITSPRQNATATIIGTKIINMDYSGAVGTRTIGLLSTVLPINALNVNVTAGSDIIGHGNGAVFNNLNFTGFSGSLNNVSRAIYGDLVFSSSMTCNAGAAITTFAATSGTKQITTAGLTLDFPLTFNGIGGTFAFQDALTQGSTRAFTITNGTVQLKDGATSTVGSFVASSTSQKFLQSTLLSTQATLSQAAGTVSVSDLNIRDINAVGGASWNAYTDFENTDAGNNDGWNFSLSPPYSTAELPITLRPFTQLRRF